ncbi:hypothetical protein BDE02_19G069300 [Populus trichocarpa]|nr:hypothetical protein BDE02_19G069300 [Populus trichocarpa]
MFIRMEGSLSTFLLTERVVSIKASLYHIRVRFISCACFLSAYLKSLASPSGAKSSSNGRDFWMLELNFEEMGSLCCLELAEPGRFCRKRKTE